MNPVDQVQGNVRLTHEAAVADEYLVLHQSGQREGVERGGKRVEQLSRVVRVESVVVFREDLVLLCFLSQYIDGRALLIRVRKRLTKPIQLFCALASWFPLFRKTQPGRSSIKR